jgi:hypothetical protein
MFKPRRWIPTHTYVGRTSIETSVKEWTWNVRDGLRVTYKDGTTLRSEYGTLTGFRYALARGHEHAREVEY